MRLDLVIGRRVLQNGLVLATTIITCSALPADSDRSSASSLPESSGAPQSAEQGNNTSDTTPAPRGNRAGSLDSQHGQFDRASRGNNMQQEKFVQKALMGGQMEVQVGQLAQQQGQSQKVKDLGQKLVQDHTQANQQLQQIAQSLNISTHEMQEPGQHFGQPNGQNRPPSSRPPGFQSQPDQSSSAQGNSAASQTGDQSQTANDSFDRSSRNSRRAGLQGENSARADHEMAPGAMNKHSQELTKLRSLNGAEFDKEFVKMAIKDHRKDIKEFEQAQKNLENSQLTSFIQQTLPKLREHLQLAQAAAQEVGVDLTSIPNEPGEDIETPSAVGAPAGGQTGSKDRGSLDQDNGTTLSGNAQIGDRQLGANVNTDVDYKDRAATVDVDTDTDTHHGKIFQKGDGKVLGLPTSKTDGKILGLFPAPGGKDKKDADIDRDQSVGAPAQNETGRSTDEPK